ncbi:MAG TPA: ATP-binding protein [bacterium]|nr:ATP-binding protein [bacterium]HPN43161.1 ATP-binding protein [bacterium]
MSKIEFIEESIHSEKVNQLNPAFFNFLSQMADSIADEIRNPLAGIAATISMLKEEIKDHIDSSKLQTIDSCIQRIDSFIEDLYLLTRPLNPSFIKIHFHSFVDQVVKQFFLNKNTVYHFETSDEEIFVWADLILLQNALVNILQNAVDATQHDGEIFIDYEYTKLDNKPAIALIIEDTGVGIDKKIMEKLFTPFYTTKHNGRGLGLVMARNYIMLHRGQIEIKSQVNAGTKVNIILPKLPGRE